MCNQRAMVLRKNRSQEGNVAWFWGCASYPICKQTFQYVVPV
jgi:ssDNA-binding Zn-finger/Zn-ribbon topoisomerase 1